MNIRVLMDTWDLPWSETQKGLARQGQRTHTNATNPKGPRRAVMGKEKIRKTMVKKAAKGRQGQERKERRSDRDYSYPVYLQ